MSAGVRCFMVEHVSHEGAYSEHDPVQWRRVDTGEVLGTARDLPAGAMWNADWMPGAETTPDGRYICVRLPNGRDWSPDSGSSNCTRQSQPHDCWCRHGEPPHLTVDKAPEPGRSTCEAGAGSIGSAEGTADYWHGFLRDGELVVA